MNRQIDVWVVSNPKQFWSNFFTCFFFLRSQWYLHEISWLLSGFKSHWNLGWIKFHVIFLMHAYEKSDQKVFYFRLSWVYILFHVRYYNSFPCPFQSFDFDILILFMMFRDSTDLHIWLCSIMLTLKNKDCLLKR